MISSLFEWLDFQDRQALKIDSSLPAVALIQINRKFEARQDETRAGKRRDF